MKTKGIRILDKEGNHVSVTLPDILKEIHIGKNFKFSILYVDTVGSMGPEISVLSFENQVNRSENGLLISWDDLNILSNKFYELLDILIIGSKDANLLHRYENDQEMYETCDLTINMFDSCFWEVFSKDTDVINRLAKKFKEIKFLESDFEK